VKKLSIRGWCSEKKSVRDEGKESEDGEERMRVVEGGRG